MDNNQVIAFFQQRTKGFIVARNIAREMDLESQAKHFEEKAVESAQKWSEEIDRAHGKLV